MGAKEKKAALNELVNMLAEIAVEDYLREEENKRVGVTTMEENAKLPRAPERTTTGFAFSIVDRAIKEGCAARKFGKPEMRQVLEELTGARAECIYCGSSDLGRWDHLVPIAKGGDTVLGNVVPACGRCDDSKRDLHYEEWVRSGARFSPRSLSVPDIDERIGRIKEYVRKYDYEPRSLADRLDEEELCELTEIQKKLKGVRKDIEDLIRRFQARTRQA